jgi:hypothetical protein
MITTAAIKIFLERFDLCEEVYCFENAKAAYYRIRESLASKDMGFDQEPKE